jgi:ribosomal protein S18 acetylase RimI-like enzyme
MADSIPAAWLKINGLNKETISISMLVVDDKFKHKGIGRFSLNYSEDYARKNNKSVILIYTTKDNTIAKMRYLKCEYEITRELVYKVGDGIDREGYEFKKIIA